MCVGSRKTTAWVVFVFKRVPFLLRKSIFCTSAACYTVFMRSKKISLIIILVVCICVAIALIAFRSSAPRETIPDVVVSDESEVALVEEYLRANIRTDAPEAPVLGGTWYVTDVVVNTATKTGSVSYEDGHIMGSALFSYKLRGGSVVIETMEKIESRGE